MPLTIVTCFQATASSDPIPPVLEPPLRAGLAFTPAFKLMITGRDFVVPIKVDSKDILEPLLYALNLTQEVTWSMNHMNQSYPTVHLLQRALSTFNASFEKLFDDVSSYLRAISGKASHARYTRGALNFVGSLANLLFGTATQEEVNNIHNKINKLETLTENERNQLNVHTKLLNITIRDMRHIQSAIERLETAANNTFKLIRQFSLQTQELMGEMTILETTVLLQLALSDLNHDLNNLKLGLQDMMYSNVSPLIINDEVFIQLLRNASTRLSGLIFPPQPQFLSMYRDISRIYTRTQRSDVNILVFYLLVPMRGDPQDIFDVFRLHQLPVKMHDTFVQIQTNAKYLAVSEDRRSYILIDSVEKCKNHNNLYICPPVGPIYTQHTPVCEIALFLQKKEATNLCRKQIIQSIKPTFLKISSGWVFTVDKPTSLTMVCLSNSLQKLKQTINGTGILSVGPSCSVHADTFTLPALDTITDGTPLTVHQTSLPLPILLAGWEKAILRQLPNITLPSIPAYQPVNLDVLSSQLATVRAPPIDPPAHLLPWWELVLLGAGIPILLLLLGLAIYICWLRRTQLKDTDMQLYARPPTPLPRGRGRSGEGVCREAEEDPLYASVDLMQHNKDSKVKRKQRK